MLRVSKLADYATVVMTYLARDASNFHNANHIAIATAISVPTVRKLLKLLAVAGLLHSVRGTKGGYGLAKRAEQISVGQIIMAIEHHAGLTECSHQIGSCALEPICVVRNNWRLIDKAIQAALESVMLADLAKPLTTNVINIAKFQAMVRGRNHGKNRTTD